MDDRKPTRHSINIVSSFDETQLFSESFGEGPLTLVPCNGLGVSTFFWKYLARFFAPTCRVILWDYRGHGKSGPAPDLHDLTMANNARDLLAVLDFHKVDKAILLGHSMGVQTILEFYRLYPERVAGLIPVLGSYGSPINSFLNTDIFTYIFPVAHTIAFTIPGFFNRVVKSVITGPLAFPGAKIIGLVNWQHCKREELKPYLEHLSQLDLRVFFGMGKWMQEHNARDLLTRIAVPTLIIAGEDDIFTPWRISEEMYRTIPAAEILTIPHGSHAAIIEQPELINLRIEKFIRDRFDGCGHGSAEKTGDAKPPVSPKMRKRAVGAAKPTTGRKKTA